MVIEKILLSKTKLLKKNFSPISTGFSTPFHHHMGMTIPKTPAMALVDTFLAPTGAQEMLIYV